MQVGSKATDEAKRANQPTQESREPLLRTKLFIPTVRGKRVTRPGLIEKINKSLEEALILVSAPAGFGKTTLLAEWATQASLPVAWVSLDPGDNDPKRFLRYVIAALNTALVEGEDSICGTARAMLRSAQPLPIQTILISLINDLTDFPKPFALVLDDFQFISSPEVNEVLTFLFERLPPHLHLVIATRVDPSIPLHNLRAAQRLLEIRTDRLRFSREETDEFMNAVMELNLSGEEISTLTDRTEGWIVGLQMAALSMQNIADRSAYIQALSGSQRYILEYLIEEVLNRQPENLQRFLLQTSILDRLCAPLCEAVMGSQEDSQGILEHLERSNLFLTPLDDVGRWYRYHHLFADLLRARLRLSNPESLPSLHLRASQWYEEAWLPEEAVQHALVAKELERAADLVERFAFEILSRGEMSSLLDLFGALPEELILSRPPLCIRFSWALTFSGQLDKVEPLLLQVEKQILPDDRTNEARVLLGNMTLIRALAADFHGEMETVVELAQQADKLLPEENWGERSLIPYVLGDGYLAAGELDKAERAFETIKEMGQTSGILWTVSVALHKLALLKKLQGKLRSAEGLFRDAIRFVSERGGQGYGNIGATYVGLSDLLRERNELETARQMATRAIENMEGWNNPTDLVNGYVTLARIFLSQGEIEIAENALEKAGEVSRQGNVFPLTRVTLEATQVRLWLEKGDIGKLDLWAEERGLADVPSAKGLQPDLVSELELISLSRALIARNELDRALDLLISLAETAEISGRKGRLIEVLVLEALVLHGQRKRDQALSVLTKCLSLAEPEGYARVFLDEGRPMEGLFTACQGFLEGSLRGYIDRLLEAFKILPGGQTSLPAFPHKIESLIEPLTEREIEVLRLLAAGLSNVEIAERLVLAEGTIKTHAHNLYGKLGVQSRTQAIARAVELKLL